MPARNERQALERERAELLKQMADYRQELENAPVLRKGRRERLEWQLVNAQRRLGWVEARLGGLPLAKELVSAEQVCRMLVVLGQPYERIEPMSPPYPDVRVTTSSGSRIAVETREVPWGVGLTGGSPIRQQEGSAIRQGVARTYSVQTDPIPGIVQAVEHKCSKSYQLDGDEDVWLLLLGGSSAAPASTFILTMYLDLVRLNGLTGDRLSGSGFSRCYLFCELTERGRPALYGWDRRAGSAWRQIV